MKHSKRPRKPNKEEITDLIAFQIDRDPFDYTREELEGIIAGETYIAVFDDYYELGGKGKLMVVVWPNNDYYDVFTWDIEGHISHHENKFAN